MALLDMPFTQVILLVRPIIRTLAPEGPDIQTVAPPAKGVMSIGPTRNLLQGKGVTSFPRGGCSQRICLRFYI
jgi:hypothetical protein